MAAAPAAGQDAVRAAASTAPRPAKPRAAHQQAFGDLQATWDQIHDAHALTGQAIDLMRHAGAHLDTPPGPAGLAPAQVAPPSPPPSP